MASTMSSPLNLTRRRASSSSQRYASTKVPVRSYLSSRPSIVLELNPNALDECRGLADASTAAPSSLGILHRFDQSFSSSTIRTQRSSSVKSGKFPCSVCQRKASCLCQGCASRKVHFYKKRSAQTELIRKRDEIGHDIEEVLRVQIKVEKTMLSTRESITDLKFRIEQKRKSIFEKKRNLKEINERLARAQKNIADLQVICNQHEKVLARPSSARKTEVEQYRRKFYERQCEMALQLFKEVFPLAKQEKKCGECVCLEQSEQDRRIPEQIADASRSTKDGKELLTPVVEESQKPTIHYSINGFCLNDCGEYGMKCWPKCGTVCQSRDSSLAMHSALAALTYGVQLVAILPFLFDILLPCQVSLRELALCEKLSDGSLSVDIAKLNVSVVFLCLSQGIDPSLIDPRRPFANLMVLYEALSFSAEQQMAIRPLVISEQLIRIVEDDFKRIKVAERERVQVAEDDWCLVQDNDIEMLKRAL
ncbi:Beclin 1-associated autophagy-related key regulator [Toxocara canis]|uniref:Beclin 1-associated autophagy-related key regulator n=1 Tax=Toxocara canis TaxID=6265 RepID=A0A0B2UZJ2_TOXCA|nr:Beclin 1-associated autophagy-related key regulator [Toxocara canis]